MDARTTRFTDRIASLFEHDGLPPIAGRIFALLLLSEEARSLDQLAAELGVSKASASTNARLLAAVRRDRAGPAAGQPARLLPDRRRPLRAIHGGSGWSDGSEFTDVIGEGRRTLPLASPSGPRAAGALRERLQLHGRCDRPRAWYAGAPCHRGGLHVRGPGGEARRPRVGAPPRGVRWDAERLGCARRLAPSRGSVDAAGRRAPQHRAGRHLRRAPRFRPTSPTGSGASRWPRSWISASGTTPPPGSRGPTRRPRRRSTAPSAARGSPRSTAT